MNQTIDPIKLKAAAEHLEWVLKQYPDNEDVQALLSGLTPLIEDAKASRVLQPLERIPFEYNFSDGVYIPYKHPSVGAAYAAFAIEMGGGLTEEDEQRIARMQAIREARKAEGSAT